MLRLMWMCRLTVHDIGGFYDINSWVRLVKAPDRVLEWGWPTSSSPSLPPSLLPLQDAAMIRSSTQRHRLYEAFLINDAMVFHIDRDNSVFALWQHTHTHTHTQGHQQNGVGMWRPRRADTCAAAFILCRVFTQVNEVTRFVCYWTHRSLPLSHSPRP